MTAVVRFLVRNLVWILFSVALMPVASAWGQVPQAPPDGASVSSVSSTQDASSSTAVSTQTPSDNRETTDAGPGFSFFRVVGGLGLVISLIILGTFGIRKYAPQYFAKKAPERTLKLIETLPMGERRSIAVIEIDERRLLIGNTPNQITLLATLGDGSTMLADNNAVAEAAALRSPGAGFKNLYEVEKNGPARAKMTLIPPDIRAKMRQLRESLEK